MSKKQHSKGKKRPRGWHRSKSSSKHYWLKLMRLKEKEKDDGSVRSTDD